MRTAVAGFLFLAPFCAQLLIGSDENFLCHVLSVMEIAQLRVCERVHTGLILVHQESKRRWISIETLSNNMPIFRLHSVTPLVNTFIYKMPPMMRSVTEKI
jgi:hypothetical protein